MRLRFRRCQQNLPGEPHTVRARVCEYESVGHELQCPSPRLVFMAASRGSCSYSLPPGPSSFGRRVGAPEAWHTHTPLTHSLVLVFLFFVSHILIKQTSEWHREWTCEREVGGPIGTMLHSNIVSSEHGAPWWHGWPLAALVLGSSWAGRAPVAVVRSGVAWRQCRVGYRGTGIAVWCGEGGGEQSPCACLAWPVVTCLAVTWCDLTLTPKTPKTV